MLTYGCGFLSSPIRAGSPTVGTSRPLSIPRFELYLENEVLLKLASLFNSGCKDVLIGSLALVKVALPSCLALTICSDCLLLWVPCLLTPERVWRPVWFTPTPTSDAAHGTWSPKLSEVDLPGRPVCSCSVVQGI